MIKVAYDRLILNDKLLRIELQRSTIQGPNHQVLARQVRRH